MSQGVRARSPNGLLVGIGLVVVAVYLYVLFYLMDHSTYDSWGAMIVGPVLFLATLPALARQARREGNPRLFWFLVAALAVKMLFSLFRWYHAFNVVESADARGYDRVGTQVAMRFLGGNFDPGLETLLDTNFIRLFTGIVYTIIRPSVIAGFLIYGWLAFWGTFFFYRAFVLAIPEGGRRSYARWVFFTPSILFWPSSIGKESWLIFGLGLAAFGAAKMLSERILPGLLVAGIGLGLAALVRAPIAVVMGLGLVVGGLLRRPSRHLGELGPIAKALSIALLIGVLVVLGVTMQGYLSRSGYGSSLDTALTESQRVTSQGGSEFVPATLTSPTGVVAVVGTVLFRPFLFEVGSADAAAEAVAAALEGTVLLIVCVVRFRSILAALRSIRRTPYVAVALVYIAGSIVGLSTVANFGIIARQRTLLYPMLFVLTCFSVKRRARTDEEVRVDVEAPAVTAGARA
jgi:hypothetical protein